MFHRFDNSSDLQFGLWKEKDAHLFLLFLTQMFCKEMKQCHEYYSGSLLSYRLQHKRSQFNHFGNRSISFSHLHCLQPGSPAVKLSFCLLPAGFSFCPFSLRPPFLVTLARTCLCCGAEWKQIIHFIIKVLSLSLKMLGQWCVSHFFDSTSTSLDFKSNTEYEIKVLTLSFKGNVFISMLGELAVLFYSWPLCTKDYYFYGSMWTYKLLN